MLKFQKMNKRSAAMILMGFLSLTLLVSGCLSIFEWNDFENSWVRNGNYMTFTITGNLHISGAADSIAWSGHRHAIEAFCFPDTWTGDTLKTTYQVYKIKSPSDSLMKTSTMTWHTSLAVAEMAEAKAPAEKGNFYRGFESDSTINWSDISGLVGSGYRIQYVSTLTVFNAPSVGPRLCGQILGDQIDKLWSGRSFMIDHSSTPPYAPTLTQWGVIVMVSLLVGSAVLIMIRRKRPAPLS